MGWEVGGQQGFIIEKGKGPEVLPLMPHPGKQEERKRGKTHPFHSLLSDDAFRSHGENGKHELPLSQLLRQTLSLASESSS